MLQREGVITGQVLDSVVSASPSVPNQREVLLAAIIVAIESKYSLLQTFASVLCKFTGNVKLGTVIQRDYDEKFIDDSQLVSDDEAQEPSELSDSNKSTPTTVAPLYIPQYKSQDFDVLYAKFAKMFSNVRKVISKRPPSLEDLKTFIEDFDSDLEAELSLIKNFQGVMRLIRKKCSLANIVILEAVVEHFEIDDAQKYIDDYKREIDESCRNLSVDLCLNEPFDVVRASPPLKCETATYVLGWEATEHKLKDVTDIVSKSSGKFVKLVNIKSIQSITITCSFPHSLTGALIIKLSENLELLIKNGLMKLTVGYCTIWKKENIEEIQEPLEEERQKELKETAQQLTNIISEKEKELYEMKKKVQELSLINKNKENQNEEECTLVELKEVEEATNDLEEKLQSLKTEYHIKCRIHSTSASYKIIKGMRMEIEQILTNKTGLLDQNESLIDIKREIAELQEQISVMSVRILNKREENEEMMHRIKVSLIDYKRDTLKLDQEISIEQTLDKREEDQQVIHQEIKEKLDRLIINVELHQTEEPSNTSREETGKVKWSSALTEPSVGQCQEVISQSTDSHQDISLYHSSPDFVQPLSSQHSDSIDTPGGARFGPAPAARRTNEREPQASEFNRQKQVYVATQKYNAIGPRRELFLSFERGEEIFIKDKDHEWWEGVVLRTGQRGYVLPNYLRPQGPPQPSPEDVLVQMRQKLSEYSWYIGMRTRIDTDVALHKSRNGVFLIRESMDRPGEYAIALKWGGMPKHIKIMRNPQTERFYISDTCDFDSIEELVDYYQKNTLGISFPGVDTTLNIPYSDTARQRHHAVSDSSSSSMSMMSPPPFNRDGDTWVEAVYDYDGEGPGFLSFHKHDHIKVLTKDTQKLSLWLGKFNGKTGLFRPDHTVPLN
ncbi:PREDICTED: uncharacterized protein LOC109586932 [Amphimedon queenslandica]|nr:PREDICTED: uncharacterized protein LOC109586932 [Amphimedon queenslandica]|eukprot:XP_019858709.1 PREDICTED: uncharacterized protein LOC109586932 [Amphimedon queenslandica]